MKVSEINPVRDRVVVEMTVDELAVITHHVGESMPTVPWEERACQTAWAEGNRVFEENYVGGLKSYMGAK